MKMRRFRLPLTQYLRGEVLKDEELTWAVNSWRRSSPSGPSQDFAIRLLSLLWAHKCDSSVTRLHHATTTHGRGLVAPQPIAPSDASQTASQTYPTSGSCSAPQKLSTYGFSSWVHLLDSASTGSRRASRRQVL